MCEGWWRRKEDVGSFESFRTGFKIDRRLDVLGADDQLSDVVFGHSGQDVVP